MAIIVHLVLAGVCDSFLKQKTGLFWLHIYHHFSVNVFQSVAVCDRFTCTNVKPLALTQLPEVINRIHHLVSIYVQCVP